MLFAFLLVVSPFTLISFFLPFIFTFALLTIITIIIRIRIFVVLCIRVIFYYTHVILNSQRYQLILKLISNVLVVIHLVSNLSQLLLFLIIMLLILHVRHLQSFKEIEETLLLYCLCLLSLLVLLFDLFLSNILAVFPLELCGYDLLNDILLRNHISLLQYLVIKEIVVLKPEL